MALRVLVVMVIVVSLVSCIEPVPVDVGEGLRGSYFDSTSGERVVSRVDSSVDFDWGLGAPVDGVPEDYFSVVWDGEIRVPASGSYEFFVRVDDGARLFVDGVSVLPSDAWRNQSASVYSGLLFLDEGRYPLRLEYYEAHSLASVQLNWSGPGVSGVIASEYLYPAQLPVSSPPSGVAVAPGDSSDEPPGVDVGEGHEAILGTIEGFARGTTGGAGGRVYTVTSTADSGQGSLRYALESDERLWIRFDPSLEEIAIPRPIRAKPHKTIDGRGSDVVLRHANGDAGSIWLASDSIVYNMHMFGYDGIPLRVLGPVDNVWIAHNTFETSREAAGRNKAIGLGSYPRGSDPPRNVTIAWNRFINIPGQPKSYPLLAGMDITHTTDEHMTITLHHNYFDDTSLRQPLFRYGYLHMYNNYVRGWASVASDIRLGARALIERNVYEKGPGTTNPAVRFSIEGEANVRLHENWMVHDEPAFANKAHLVPDPPYTYVAQVADDALRQQVRTDSGRRSIPFP